jgi:hypothetical protein
MKKIIIGCLIGIGLTSLVALKGANYEPKKATGEVEQMQGLYIFTDSKPVLDYEYLGTVKVTFALDAQYQGVRDKLIKKAKTDKNQLLLRVKLGTVQGIMGESYHYFVPPKEMKLQSAALQMKWLTPGVLEITNTGSLAKDVYLELPTGRFSDNYFDLLPGSTKILTVKQAPTETLNTWARQNHFPSLMLLNAFYDK